MLFFKNNKNSLPQQVSENMKRIEVLEAYVKQSYYTRYEYGDDILPTPWAVDLISTDIPLDTEIGAFDGFLLSKDAKLFSIINIQYEYDQQGVPYKIVNANYVCDIRGEPGTDGTDGVDGVTPEISANATVSNTTGTPSVTVTKTGTDENPTFTFAFENLKGEQGEQGFAGEQIYTTSYVDGPHEAGDTLELLLSQTDIPSDTPIGTLDDLLLTGSANVYSNLTIYTSNGAKYVSGDYTTNVRGPAGEQGPAGQDGQDGTDGIDGTDGVTPNITMNASVNNTTGTPSVTVTQSGTTEDPVFSLAFSNLKGDTGAQGEAGTYIYNDSTGGSLYSYTYFDISKTNIPLDTPTGNFDGLLYTQDGRIYDQLNKVNNPTPTQEIYAHCCMILKGDAGTYIFTGQTTTYTVGNYYDFDITDTSVPTSIPVGSFDGIMYSSNGYIFDTLSHVTGGSGNKVRCRCSMYLKGDKGDDAVTLSIGTVTEGSPADASLTSDGNGNYELDLTIPSGGGGGSDPDALKVKYGSNFPFPLAQNSYAQGCCLPPIGCIYYKDTQKLNIPDLIQHILTYTQNHFQFWSEDMFDLSNIWCDGFNVYYFDYIIDEETGDVEQYYFMMSDEYTWRDISTTSTPNTRSMSDFYIHGRSIFDMGNGNFIHADYDYNNLPSSLMLDQKFLLIRPSRAVSNGSYYMIAPSIYDCYLDSSAMILGVIYTNIDYTSRIIRINNFNYIKITLYGSGTTYYYRLYLQLNMTNGEPVDPTLKVIQEPNLFGGLKPDKPDIIIAEKSIYLIDRTDANETNAVFKKVSNESNYPANAVNLYYYDYEHDQICEAFFTKSSGYHVNSFVNFKGHLILDAKFQYIYTLNDTPVTGTVEHAVEVLDDNNGNVLLYPVIFKLPDTNEDYLYEDWTTIPPQTFMSVPYFFHIDDVTLVSADMDTGSFAVFELCDRLR